MVGWWIGAEQEELHKEDMEDGRGEEGPKHGHKRSKRKTE